MEIPTTASFTEAVRLRDAGKTKSQMAKMLRDLADAIMTDSLEFPADALAVVTRGPKGPNVCYTGYRSWDELKDNATDLHHGIWGAYWSACKRGDKKEDQSASEAARERAEQRERYRQAEGDKKAQYAISHPWLCESDKCGRRFTTERGAKAHERACWYIKQGEL